MPLTSIQTSCAALNIRTRLYNNFIVIYDPQYTFTIFKQKRVAGHNNNNNTTSNSTSPRGRRHRRRRLHRQQVLPPPTHQHCNIYKLKHFNVDACPGVRDRLSWILGTPNRECISPVVVDNSTFMLRLSHTIDVSAFIRDNSDLQWNISKETFPGLFIKFLDCSFILFSSGVIIIVGAKQPSVVQPYIRDICARCLRTTNSANTV